MSLSERGVAQRFAKVDWNLWDYLGGKSTGLAFASTRRLQHAGGGTSKPLHPETERHRPTQSADTLQQRRRRRRRRRAPCRGSQRGAASPPCGASRGSPAAPQQVDPYAAGPPLAPSCDSRPQQSVTAKLQRRLTTDGSSRQHKAHKMTIEGELQTRQTTQGPT